MQHDDTTSHDDTTGITGGRRRTRHDERPAAWAPRRPRGNRRDTLTARGFLRAGAVMLLASLLLVLTGGSAWADGGMNAVDTHVAQTLGERELTVVIRSTGPVLGPLQVEIVTHAGTAAGTLKLAASSPSATTSTGSVTLGPEPGIHTTRLAVDAFGPWELAVDDGTTTARIPFIVPAQVVAPWQQASTYGFAASGVLLVGSLVLAMRARTSWVPWAPAVGAVVALSVAVTGTTLGAYSPSPPRAGHDVDPTMSAIADPYGQVPQAAQTSMDHTRPALTLDVSGEVVAGQPSTVDLQFLDTATGRPVDDLVVHHSALVHLMTVSSDGELLHLHPVRVDPGRYQVVFTPSAAGVHAFAAEVARRGGGTQLLRTSVDVRPGTPEPDARAAPRGGGEVAVDVAAAGTPSTVRSRFGDTPTLQPWLGMVGHLIVVGPLAPGAPEGEAAADAPIWSHGHAMPPSAPGAAAGQPDESVAVFGPDVEFVHTFARPGRYRVWVQAERDFTVHTAPTEVEVPA